MKRLFSAIIAALLLSACQGMATKSDDLSADFFAEVAPLCGQAFEGQVVSTDPQDEDWRAERLVMHVAVCDSDEIQIPLHVGDDRSRTWFLTRVESASQNESRILFSHRHLHEDGSPDVITGYGGVGLVSAPRHRMMFPASDETRDLFVAEGIPESQKNIWAIEVRSDEDLFAYEMRRPGRFFRAEFDLSKPVETPPPPWGED